MANADIKEVSQSLDNATADQRVAAIKNLMEEFVKLEPSTIEALVIGAMTNDPNSNRPPVFVSFAGEKDVVTRLIMSVTSSFVEKASED